MLRWISIPLLALVLFWIGMVQITGLWLPWHWPDNYARIYIILSGGISCLFIIGLIKENKRP